MRRLIAGAAALVVVIGVSLGGWWYATRDDGQARMRQAADVVAASLSTGSLPPGVRGAEGAAPPELGPLLSGMGTIPHEVAVVSVTPASDGRSATLRLRHTWRVHAGKEPWTYATSATLRAPEQAGDGTSWSLVWSPEVLAPGLRAGERLAATRLPASRGRIIGAEGVPLVTSRDIVRIGIDRSTTNPGSALASAPRLAALLDVEAAPYVAAVRGAGPKQFVQALVVRADDPRLRGVTAAKLPGVTTVAGSMPLPPTAQFARPLLGTVGDATAEIVARSGGRVRAGDVVGLSGLQAAHEQSLAGTAGYVVEAMAGTQVRDLHRVPAVTGTDLRITLDQMLQLKAEATLADVAPASALVAIRPSDGAILAAASGPGSKGYSTATLGQYAPGSTFKIVTAAALLGTGIGPQTPVECAPTISVAGRSFTNYDAYPSDGLGRITFAEAIARSCNTALIRLADTVGGTGLVDAAAQLGLTGEPHAGVPAFLGRVPATDATTGATERAARMIGQGEVLASPLGMATVAASVAAGRTVSPVLVPSPPATEQAPQPSRSSGSTATTATAAASAGSPIAVAPQLRDLMRGVVTNGSARFLADVPAPPVLAKTGTAEYGSATPPRTHAWMIAVHGDLAVAVFVQDGAGGARTAGPLLESFLQELGR